MISGAIEKRQREFRAGRHCAHAALQRINIKPQPILMEENRAPMWPPSVAGTIAHCKDYCIAACAWRENILSLGVDVEPIKPLKPGIGRYIHSPKEQAYLDAHPELPERLIFCAKESLYKCYSPVIKRFFGFHAVEIQIDPECQSFRFQAGNKSGFELPNPERFSGRYLVTDKHIICGSYLMPE